MIFLAASGMRLPIGRLLDAVVWVSRHLASCQSIPISMVERKIGEGKKMATVEVLKIEKQAFGKVKVLIEARTAGGRYTFPVDIDDHGSPAANEDQALRDLQRLVEELADVLRLRIGS
jgi:hypothetical protein